MSIQIISKGEQGKGAFNGGQIVENKPIGFPQDGGPIGPYSNLFYWAHAKAVEDSTIGLHPHKGFEIMSVILNGPVRHFDTKANEWLPLKTGDVQIIRSGSGISHSEHMGEGAEMFQIWFDPGLEKTLRQDASYNDYRAADFPTEDSNGAKITKYIGPGAPIEMDSPSVTMKKVEVKSGAYELETAETNVTSLYILEGNPSLKDQELSVSDFIRVENGETLAFNSGDSYTLFILQTPKALSYRTYTEMMQARF